MQIALLLSRPGRLRQLVLTVAITTAAAAVAATAVLNDHPSLEDGTTASAAGDLAMGAIVARHAPLSETAPLSIADKPDAMLPGMDEPHAATTE